jgi:hypothetical protein
MIYYNDISAFGQERVDEIIIKEYNTVAKNNGRARAPAERKNYGKR